MLYLVIERFHQDKVKQLYERFDKEGRLMPDGLKYINSWIDKDLKVCYQIMECESQDDLMEWIENWKDYAEFEIIEVITSTEAKNRILGK